MNIIKEFRDDFKSGENLEIYLLLIVSLGVLILDIKDNVNIEVINAVILAALGVLVKSYISCKKMV